MYIYNLQINMKKQKKESYVKNINDELIPKRIGKFLALDLFAGCGGLALGFEAAGFKTMGFEMDSDCCKTYNHNLNGKCQQLLLTKDSNLPKADIIIAGPPCQPFSVRGKQKGLKDSRDGFPIFISAVKRIKPTLFMFENVRGLLYKNKGYLDRILKELNNLGYKTEVNLMNTSDYGVPQNRQRVIVIGHKHKFNFPDKFNTKIISGEALVKIPKHNEEPRYLTPSMDKYIARYEKASHCKVPRDLHLDRPSRTLTCRNIAAATSDMHRIVLPNGKRRMLFIREAARLQSFPDWFVFCGKKDSQFKQIGNAVAPYFSLQLAKKMREHLDNIHNSKSL
ncbi:DNA cytosine methyltransferase [Nanoarchaeota archaeon]